MVVEIDYDELDRIAQMHRQWRGLYPALSNVHVMGEGDNPEAFIFGEAPGATEEIKERPFVGQTGKVLRQLMAFAGLAAAISDHWHNPKHPLYGKANCWLTNVVQFRPPHNRTPTDLEITSVRPLLRREWEAVGKPPVIIPVGGVALFALTGRKQSILRAAGKLHRYRDLYVWPMVHPSYAIRNNSDRLKELLEEDWIKLGKWLDGSRN